MTLNQLYYFQKLSETHHMGRAAEVLYISQPSLSVSISKLEQELQVPLFDRSGHTITLTAEGQLFSEHVNKILGEVSETIEHMKSIIDQKEHLIRIGCIQPLFDTFVPKFMKSFLDLQQNTDISFNLSVDTTPELIRQLKDGVFDFVFCCQTDDETLHQIEILKEPLVLITPYKTLQPSLPTSWNDIAASALIGYSSNTTMDNILKVIAKKENITLNYAYRVPTAEAITALVEHGFGYGIVPQISALTNYAVKTSSLPSGNYSRSVFLTIKNSSVAVGATKQFLDFIIQT